MLLIDLIALATDKIKNDEKHTDYARTVNYADTCKKLSTGNNIESLLMQYIRREDAEMFAQRVALTRITTPAVIAAVKSPFAKVTRNNKIAKDIGLKDEGKHKIVETMMKSFFGSKRKKTNGLENFLRTRFLDYTFTDPNAWIVVEWKAAPLGQVIEPTPFVVRAAEAYNFSIVNEDVKWLHVRNAIKYPKNNPNDKINPIQFVEGWKHTFYDEDFTAVFQQIDKDYFDKNSELGQNESIVEIVGIWYLLQTFTPNLGFAPAFRIGYVRDLETEGRTFVAPFEPAMCYLQKSIKTTSELDLTMTLHAFPQKAQYIQRCKGVSPERKCLAGKCGDGSVCTGCNGSGYKVHTTAQDVILLPLPEDKEEMFDLEKLIAYISPPSDIIKIQMDYQKELKQDCMTAVFNSQMFTQMSTVKTATEKTLDMDSVYDTISGFAEQFSSLWKDLVSVFIVLSGANLEEVEPIHAFPADFKLKTLAMLQQELIDISQSEAPAFLRDAINQDIAEVMYAQNPVALTKYNIKRRFFPYNGKTNDEITLAMASPYVTKFDKVLFYNFDKIFTELEKDDVGFWFKKFEDQWKVVGEKVNIIIEELDKVEADRFNVGDLTGADATNNSDPANKGGANPGSNGN